MKTATVAVLKKELAHYSQPELMELCLRLARFKKENKELLTYLIFEAGNEEAYIGSVKAQMDEAFADINSTSMYYVKKSVRKILSGVKKNIRYSQKKETEVELLLYFCRKLRTMKPSFTKSPILRNTFQTQLRMIRKAMEKLHEDLQYDYGVELERLES
ncbi:hypothetical protein Oweho_2892 [Owenweeksia hongkongensis DSM 17368]|uniref:Uncharacterized protein n=1 Tax=Owenweeksia hongkongensis (strain DSM 17368 / CIP 108786 / JCM 12287 / NRRL B-23963 / UST20020801) TaxID=926562 RepID=G8R1A7_OWEHD|nr:hypothetical protein [Owenweeksia hongkongensis]AEV33850.1 hypothetical protein Oweho_2892 [Owenweeksia hongkongensis DSM 17368]